MAHGLLKFFRSVLLGLAVSTAAVQAGESIVVASTTSTEQSGLFNFILPIFEKDSGIAVRVVALGTGQALDVGRRGDADVVLVHDRPAEDKFVADGYGVGRRDVCRREDVLRPDRALGLDLDRVPSILRRPLEPFGRHEGVGDARRARRDRHEASSARCCGHLLDRRLLRWLAGQRCAAGRASREAGRQRLNLLLDNVLRPAGTFRPGVIRQWRICRERTAPDSDPIAI